MVPRENKNNAYAKFGGTNNKYYGICRNGLLAQTSLTNDIVVLWRAGVDNRVVKSLLCKTLQDFRGLGQERCHR